MAEAEVEVVVAFTYARDKRTHARTCPQVVKAFELSFHFPLSGRRRSLHTNSLHGRERRWKNVKLKS